MHNNNYGLPESLEKFDYERERVHAAFWIADLVAPLHVLGEYAYGRASRAERDRAVEQLALRGLTPTRAREVRRWPLKRLIASGLHRRPRRVYIAPGATEVWLHVTEDGRETFYPEWRPDLPLVRVHRGPDASGKLVERTVTRDRGRTVIERSEARLFRAMLPMRPPGEGWVIDPSNDKESVTGWMRPARASTTEGGL